MYLLSSLRKEFGDHFVTEFADGTIIPWRVLCVGDFLKYEIEFSLNRHPIAEIENEIFSKCVLDSGIVANLFCLKAGIVSTVSAHIMEQSGPRSPEQMNYALELGRRIANTAMHQCVISITQAFPAYTPEDIYAMDYETMMLRLAQAEAKMIGMGIWNEPVSFIAPGQKEKPKKPQKPKVKPQDLKQTFEQQQAPIPKPPPAPKPPVSKSVEQTIITQQDILEHKAAMSGHDQDIVATREMTNDTAQFYADYINQMKEGKKISVKTDEERVAEANARSEAIKKKLIEQQKQQAIANKEELKELLKVRERERIRRAKRKRR